MDLVFALEILLSVCPLWKKFHNQTCFKEDQVLNTLDLVILSNPDCPIKNVIITLVGISDYVVIILELFLPTKQPSSKQNKYVNYTWVSEKISSVNWKNLITDDINESWSIVKMEFYMLKSFAPEFFKENRQKFTVFNY